MRPVIGITAWQSNPEGGNPTVGLHAKYVRAIRAAGGEPVVLPPAEDDGRVAPGAARELVARLDGLLLSGGADVDSARWGEPLHPAAEVQPGRDAVEFALLEEARAVGLPVFGICRGCQVVNVAFGGTLAQHIPDEGKDPRHNQTHLDPPMPRGAISHTVAVAEGSRVAEAIGAGEHGVNSMHHQAVARLGGGLRATARSHDGVVEAVESEGPGWVVGVQWHPEELFEDHGEQAGLFRAFVEEAAAFARRRAAAGTRASSAGRGA